MPLVFSFDTCIDERMMHVLPMERMNHLSSTPRNGEFAPFHKVHPTLNGKPDSHGLKRRSKAFMTALLGLSGF